MKSYELSSICALHHLKRNAASLPTRSNRANLELEGTQTRVSISRLPSHPAVICTPIRPHVNATASRSGSGVALLTCARMQAHAPHGTCGSRLPRFQTSHVRRASYHNTALIYPTRQLKFISSDQSVAARDATSQKCEHPSGGNCCAGWRAGPEAMAPVTTTCSCDTQVEPKSVSTSRFKSSTCNLNRAYRFADTHFVHSCSQG